MDKKLKPFVIVGIFWIALFLFVIAGYSGSLDSSITGFAVSDASAAPPLNMQGIAILLLFFTNLVTLFFLVREVANK